MTYKVLKHKVHQNIYGYINEDYDEIWHSSTPVLFGNATTIDSLKHCYNRKEKEGIVNYLDDFLTVKQYYYGN